MSDGDVDEMGDEPSVAMPRLGRFKAVLMTSRG
jgi:hypothetical protein